VAGEIADGSTITVSVKEGKEEVGAEDTLVIEARPAESAEPPSATGG